MEEREHFGLNYWLAEELPRITLDSGATVQILPPPSFLRKINEMAKSRPLNFTRQEFREILDESKPDACQVLVSECLLCRGAGTIGAEGHEEVCSVCAGYGKSITAFGVAVLELLSFVHTEKPPITQEQLDKKNRVYHLQEKVARARSRAAEAAGYGLAWEMQKAELAARQKIAKAQEKAMRQAEKELADELAELKRLEAEEGGAN